MTSTDYIKQTDLHVRWTVHGPARNNFKFLNHEWRLDFDFSDSSFCLNLGGRSSSERATMWALAQKEMRGNWPLEAPQSTVVRENLAVEVHLQSGLSGRLLPGLSQTTAVLGGDRTPIWRRTGGELHRASAEFKHLDKPSEGDEMRLLQAASYTRNAYLRHGLKFIIVLKTKDSTSSLFNSTLMRSNIPCWESLSEDFSKLLDQDSKPDVEFQCAGQSTKAHGAVVSARSEVIASMLASDMTEGRTKVVKIPNMEPDIFKKFLSYLYTGKLDKPTFEDALNLFQAGDQYAVTGLFKRCSEYLVEHLSVQNACEVLVVADAHGDKGLVEKVVDFMVSNRVPLAASEVWPAFCDEYWKLASKVLNRMVVKLC